MIRYIAGRNLGHLARCVATVSKFMSLSQEAVEIRSFSHTHTWLKSNLPKAKIRTFKSRQLETRGKKLLKTDLLIHDWREEVRKLKEMRKERPIIGGIYHSDISLSPSDTDWTEKFKRQIQAISQSTTDIFFHINLTQPEEVPELSTFYVPIPPIVRKITMTPPQVKDVLGIPRNEPFVLVQMGGGIGKYRYKFMNEWYGKVNNLRIPYQIVIANQLEGVNFEFRKPIIRAPLFDNGRNLVNAAAMVVSKPGMGILMDCVSTGTPLLLLPADTKEREVKNLMLRNLVGSDICLASNKFSARDLARSIEELVKHTATIRSRFAKIPKNGADIVAESMKLLSGHSLEELPDLYPKILKLTPFQAR